MSITRYSFQKGIVYAVILMIPIAHSVFAQSVHETDWKEDLKIYKESLEQKHIDVYHSVTKEAFYNDWNTIYNSADTLNDFEIILKLMHLTRRINDGHTAVSLRNSSTHRFPFEIEWIEGRWHVTKTLPENKQLLKTTLESINDIQVDTIAQKVSEIAQFVENEYSLKERTGSYIPTAELLFHLNLIDSKTKATFGFKNQHNELVTMVLEAIPHKLWEHSEVSKIKLGVPGIKRPKTAEAGFWFAPILGTKALYIHFTDYPSFEEIQVFGEHLAALIQLQLKNVDLEKMNKELQSFVYISSHDLQEPLRKIQIFASRILETEFESLSDKAKHDFTRIRKAAFRMQTLIQDLLTYSRTKVEDITYEILNLDEVIEDVQETLSEDLKNKEVTFKLDIQCQVKIIPIQFKQIIHNLISNSIKFAREEQPLVIEIDCEHVKGKDLDIETLDNYKKYCHIRFADNGIGFEQEFSERIFEVFQRLHSNDEYIGTGIGLAIVKKIIENHKGHISAMGTVNEGAIFHIYIPA